MDIFERSKVTPSYAHIATIEMIDARMIDAVVFISNVKVTHPLPGAIFNEVVKG